MKETKGKGDPKIVTDLMKAAIAAEGAEGTEKTV